jgi:hypothetical protein
MICGSVRFLHLHRSNEPLLTFLRRFFRGIDDIVRASILIACFRTPVRDHIEVKPPGEGLEPDRRNIPTTSLVLGKSVTDLSVLPIQVS